MMLDHHSLRRLFYDARTQNGWLDKSVETSQLHQIYDLMKWGPTSANCSPLRLCFLKSDSAKKRLEPYLTEGNREKTMQAPVTAILGQDLKFYRYLSRLFAHNPNIEKTFADTERSASTSATMFRNSSLQGGYFIMAVRAVGLDCGPMSGFDMHGVDREFWSGTSIQTNFLCNIGYGDRSKLFPRLPRLGFDEACSII